MDENGDEVGMRKVIIDTDPGVDDALAILLALRSHVSVAGIVTVYGNSSVHNSTVNALTILQLLNKRIPVYQGAAESLTGTITRAESHGSNGLGGFRLSKLRYEAEKKSALEFYISQLEQSKNKSVDILCIGPSTNIAMLSMARPDLCKKINKLIILGGVFDERGNISSYAEFNVFNDPLAFQKVLSLECEKIIIPINICRKVIFTKSDFDNVRNKRLQKNIQAITDLYIDYYTNDKEYGGFAGGVMYDLLAVVYLLSPDIFMVEKAFVSVVTRLSKKSGKTVLSRKGKENCSLVVRINEQEIKRAFFKYLND
jgi:purine nucleosidase